MNGTYIESLEGSTDGTKYDKFDGRSVDVLEIDTNEGTELGFSTGKVISTTLGSSEGPTVGTYDDTELGSLEGFTDGTTDGKFEGLLL